MLIAMLLEIITLSLIAWFVIKRTKITARRILAIKGFYPLLLLLATIVVMEIRIINSEIDSILILIFTCVRSLQGPIANIVSQGWIASIHLSKQLNHSVSSQEAHSPSGPKETV